MGLEGKSDWIMRPPDVDEFTGEMRTSEQREMRGATCGLMRKSEADRAHEGWPRNVAKFDITWDHASMSFLEADPGTA